MANHKSAIKRHKQSLKNAAINRGYRTRMKNAFKVVKLAIAEKDFAKADEALVKAKSAADKTASKGSIHWKTAARRVSRLHKAVARAKAQDSDK